MGAPREGLWGLWGMLCTAAGEPVELILPKVIFSSEGCALEEPPLGRKAVGALIVTDDVLLLLSVAFVGLAMLPLLTIAGAPGVELPFSEAGDFPCCWDAATAAEEVLDAMAGLLLVAFA